jgi:hypothetical protein
MTGQIITHAGGLTCTICQGVCPECPHVVVEDASRLDAQAAREIESAGAPFMAAARVGRLLEGVAQAVVDGRICALMQVEDAVRDQVQKGMEHRGFTVEWFPERFIRVSWGGS